jgi:uncharacterized SAM-binding protein YcdF (DUF218 family)
MKQYIKAGLACIAFILLIYAFHAPLLNRLGKALVRSDKIKSADCIVVLAGDPTDQRMKGAIELFKNGYAGYIVFWSGAKHYSKSAFRQLEANGVSKDKIVWSNQKLNENNTYGEALVNIELMKQKHFHSFILVTSDYHTARSGRVYASLAARNGMTMNVYPVQEKGIVLDGWWKNNAGREAVLSEWQKTIWYFFKY